MTDELKAAFIHDWLVTFGGGEQILRALWEVWPQAPVYTLLHDPTGPCGFFTTDHQVKTSFIQKIPGATRHHRLFLPLMPLAVEQFDLRSHDVLISINFAVAHGALPQPGQLHVSYICAPVRYAWHLYHQYLEEAKITRGVRSWIARVTLHYLRLWDVAAAQRVDHFVAISRWVAQNVWRAYRRQADVIYPPVDVEAFTPCERKENFYLTASRLVAYKRIDLIVEAFKRMPEKKLVVIGDGPELDKLRSQGGKNVEFRGHASLEELRGTMQRARAFVFAALEDFGIAPLEAQACGTPVIAYGKGGALETVLEGKTGLFFPEQTAESLMEAIRRFEEGNIEFDAAVIRANAERFSKERFQSEFREYVERRWAEFQENPLRSGITSL